MQIFMSSGVFGDHSPQKMDSFGVKGGRRMYGVGRGCGRFLWRLLLVTGLACGFAVPLISHAKYLKAVTYFGDAWPLNYWNSDIGRASGDFEQIKSDGFNAIILVVPWGEFQPGLKPVRFNEDAYERLRKVCSLAKQAGLHVHMRVSYQHDMYPGVELASPARFDMLLAGSDFIPAWEQYLARVAEVSRDCASGAFISWEDFWHATASMAAPMEPEAAVEMSRRMGFDAWIKTHADAAYRERYALVFKRYGAYPVPSRASSDFRMVYQWFDDRLMQHLMPVLARSLPRASIEARVDDDPIFEGGKIVQWYSHAQTYQVPSSSYLMTYWAPAMGAQNRSDRESAKKVIERFSYINQKISERTKNRIVIGQFLFQDNTPSASRNTVINPVELPDFLRMVAGPMLNQTAGYALWGARDYEASVLFNGFFSLGELGWVLKGGARVVGKSARMAELPSGASAAQLIPASRDHFRDTAKNMNLRLEAQGPGEIVVSYGEKTQRAHVGSAAESLSMQFPISQVDAQFMVKAASGKLRIGRLYLSDYTQLGDFRDVDGNPGPRFNDIRSLNKAIDEGVGVPSRLNARDKTLSKASGVFPPERNGSNWYAWAGPEVTASLLARSSTISVRGSIRPSMFQSPEGCTLKALLDDKEVSSQIYTADKPIELDIPVPATQIGKVVDLTLRSSCASRPKQQKTGEDERTLSYVLTTISSIASGGESERDSRTFQSKAR